MYDEFRHRLGTRSLDLAQWLTTDAETAPTIEMKRRLIEFRRSEVVALHEGGDSAAQEAAELVAQWTGVAAVVCSPSRWKLADKMGKNMLQVHTPVSKYAEHIGAAVETTLQRLSVDRPIWRSNWTLEDHPALFQPEPPSAPLVDDVSRMWVRIERETFRRLPRTGGILFTIRGFQQPLADDVSRYKSILPYRELVLTWLDSKL